MAGLQDFLTQQFVNETPGATNATDATSINQARQAALTDTNFYTPGAGDVQGQNWYPADDRNLPSWWNTGLPPGYTPPAPATAATPSNVHDLSGGAPIAAPTGPDGMPTNPWGGNGGDWGGASAPTKVSSGWSLSGGGFGGSVPPGASGAGSQDTNAGALATPGGMPSPWGGSGGDWSGPGGGTGTPSKSTIVSGQTPGSGSATVTAPSGTSVTTPQASPVDFSNLLSQYGLNSQQLTNGVMPTLQQIIAQMNTGFDPATLSAMRTAATSGIQSQYENAAQGERSQLLRAGAIGAGELPGSSGDILRGMAPLDQARLNATSNANEQTTLANQQEIARKQGLGMQAIGDIQGAQGQINQLLQSAISSGTQLQLANLDSQTRTLLAQMGIDSQEKLGALQAQTQMGVAGLNAQTQTTIANLNADTQKWMATLNADTQNQLAQLQATTSLKIDSLDNATKTQIANINNAPGSLKNILLAATFSSLLNGTSKGGSTGGGILGTLTNVLTNKTNPNDSSGGWSIDPESGEEVYTGPGTGSGTVGGNIASSVTSAVKSIGGAVAGGATAIGHAIGALMTNPITAVVGGAIAAAYFLFRGTAHLAANDWVQKNQNPFDTNMDQINKQFDALNASGQMTKANAQQIEDSAKGLIDTYTQQLQAFSQKGGDQATVAKQALATFNYYYGTNGTAWLNRLDSTISGLKA